MITIKHGKNEFKGEIKGFDAGSEVMIFYFMNGVELHFYNPPSRLSRLLVEIGLERVKDCTIDYFKEFVSIEQKNEETKQEKNTPKPVQNIDQISKIEV